MWTDWLQSLCHRRNVNRVLHPRALRACYSAVWNSHAKMALEINLYVLMMPFQCPILGTDWITGNLGKLRFWYRKYIIWMKSSLHCELFVLLKRAILWHVDVLKMAMGMLIVWDNFAVFFILTFLAGNLLNRGHLKWVSLYLVILSLWFLISSDFVIYSVSLIQSFLG